MSEQNSAEQEAEKILKEAYDEAQAEECPQGEECAVHFRVNEEFFDEDTQYARLITYVGENVVITDDNHLLDNPAFLLKLVLGLVKEKPNRFETVVMHVGEGSIGDLAVPVEGRVNTIRYQKTHDVWKGVGGEHKATVAMLEAGLIDVSKPLEG